MLVAVIAPVVLASSDFNSAAATEVSFTSTATLGLKFNPFASSTNRLSSMVPVTFVTAEASAHAEVNRSIV